MYVPSLLFYQFVLIIQLNWIALIWQQNREGCSAAQVDRLEKACRLQQSHCALLNKASHFMTPPCGILILTLFGLPHLPFLCFLYHKKWILFICLWIHTLPPLCLPFHSCISECWCEGKPNAGGRTSWPNQISEYPISHIDKLISLQIKWRKLPLILP